MRKMILLGLMAVMSAPVAAQTSPGELRRDRQDVREQRQDLRDAQRHGDYRDVRDQRDDLRGAKREWREDRHDAYAAPYGGWRYSALRPGARLRPGFYGQRYRVTNYDRYRLRPAAGNRQWIRYGDDLVLVNTRTGRVMEVLRNRYRG